MRLSCSKSGYSLVELLVVAAAALILLALVLPVAGSIRSRAKEVQCISNLRQIGVAVQLYGADQAVYVQFTTPTSDWSYLIKPYLAKDGQTVYSDPNERSPVVVCPMRSVVPPNVQPTYSCHRHIMTVHSQSPGPRKYGTIKRPSETLMIADSIQSAAMYASQGGWGCYAFAFQMPYSWTLGGDPSNSYLPVPTWPDLDGDGDNLRYRHGGRANILFVDGHVASIRKGELKERNVMLNY